MAKKKRKEKKEAIKKENLEEVKVSVRKKELYWLIGVMGGLILLILAISYIRQESNNFNYESLKFVKSVYGQIPIYVYNYNFKDVREEPAKEYNFNLVLRKDPRKNKVQVNGEIFFPPTKRNVYISINGSELTECKGAARDLATLTSFLAMNTFNVKSGVPDLEEAKANNYTYVTCEKYPNNAVIVIQEGNETRIDRSDANCYVISVNNCQVLDAVEKFEVQSIIDAKRRQSN